MADWKVITDYIGFGLAFIGLGVIGLGVPLFYMIGEYINHGGPYFLETGTVIGLMFVGLVMLIGLVWFPFQTYRENRKKELGDGK
jgi:multisubunit Na+/H+ antiporter MnhB subunit